MKACIHLIKNMTINIIDYGSGNLQSARNAFEKASNELNKSVEILVSKKVDDLKNASRIVLPGVGSFTDCKSGIEAIDGMMEALNYYVIKCGIPFLGICVGMQLLASKSYEDGEDDGFRWIQGDVVKIRKQKGFPVPHMGWNNLEIKNFHPILNEICSGDHAYFVHSYKFLSANKKHVIATTDYSSNVEAVIARDNIVGTQFHPEKSQEIGMKFIKNFITWQP